MTSLLTLAAAEQAAEDDKLEMPGDTFSLLALQHALDTASLAISAAVSGDPAGLSSLLLEAQRAADDTFEAGSAEAEALALVLAAIGDEAMARQP